MEIDYRYQPIKIKADGLVSIYKMISTYEGNHKFVAIKLAFQDKEKAESFRNYFNNNNLFSNRCFLDDGGYFNNSSPSSFPTYADNHVLLLKLQSWTTLELKNQGKNLDNELGNILFEELKNLVDISDVPVEFRNMWQNRPIQISQEQLKDVQYRA
jgi:hypothetical protein